MRANIYLVGDGLLLWYASSWAVIGFRQKAERLASTPLWSRNLRLQEVRVGIGLSWFYLLEATASSLEGSRFSLLGNML